ncbi:MAG TPA: FAD-dependent oxidoreductase [Xanthobacteraceae bacterium]|jgi:D-amino-acid dehydrogenase|nr:FAD-dependent oxidoreductase [Xanthobacteraceae bacterium]
MARTDVIVLGAGIVGTSIALHLARRGLSVALVDRGGPGEETSYGNSGVIGGAGVYPAAFPRRLWPLIRVGLKLATEANYHISFLPKVAPWLWAYRMASTPRRLEETARIMRPLMAHALAEHETLMEESGAGRYLRRDGWISLYRSEQAFTNMRTELELCEALGVTARTLDVDQARMLEPNLNPVFRRAIHWADIASVSNPLAVTRAYVRRFTALGGIVLQGDAMTLHRSARGWRVEASEGPIDATEVVVALGPWAPDLLKQFGIKLPLGIKRGYHQHFHAQGNAGLTRPIVDPEVGYVLAPMDQGIRLTTGAEFASRDAAATPVQIDRVMPHVRGLLPLGEPVEKQPWMGRRPIFPDSRPVIGRVPGQSGLWLALGHGHFGLTLGPVTGRLISEMMTGSTPFTDPTPFGVERFK